MANLKPQHYRLLAGPYRTAVWAILARFKTEIVAQTVVNLFELDRAERAAAAAAAAGELRTVRDELVETGAAYLALLATAIRRVDGDTAGSSAAAGERLRQIQAYLDDLVGLWSGVAETDDADEWVCAVSQLLWPYYCVVYPREVLRSGHRVPGGFNFCTWIADSNILENDSLSGAAFKLMNSRSRGRSSRKLRLIPSLDACFGDAAPLRQIIDAASLQLLDFEVVENNLGHVQELGDPHRTFLRNTDILTCMTRALVDPSDDRQVSAALGRASSAFTDLFQFTNHALRYVLTEKDMRRGEDTTPLGVLFLASPSLPAVEALVQSAGQTVEDLLRSAWEDAGGQAFTRAFHGDFQSLREQFREIDQNLRAEAAGFVSHHSKNIINNISALLRSAQTARGADQAELLRIAEHSAKYLGQEFGLLDRIRGALRARELTRDLLSVLTDEELNTLLQLQVRLLLVIRNGADLDRKRAYSLNGLEITTDQAVDEVENETRDTLAAVYERRGSPEHLERARQLRNNVDWGPYRDPLGLTLFFVCRELVDNMRPRHSDVDTRLDVRLTRLHDHPASGWRSFEIVQALSGCSEKEPFAGVDEAPSIARFNQLHGEGGTGLGQIDCDPPFFDVSQSQHILRQVLSLPSP
jgi:hypothetical protein